MRVTLSVVGLASAMCAIVGATPLEGAPSLTERWASCNNYLANFDELAAEDEAFPVGLYKGLNMKFAVQGALTGGKTGLIPKSPLMTVGFDTYTKYGIGYPTIWTGEQYSYFTLHNFYFGCDTGFDGLPPRKCSITLTGYKVGKKLGSQTFTFTPKPGLLGQKMQLAKVTKIGKVDEIRWKLDTSDAEGATLQVRLDNLSYTACENAPQA